MADFQVAFDALAVAQVEETTVSGTWASGDVAKVTINGKTLEVTVGSAATISDVVAAVVAAFNGSALVGDESRNFSGAEVAEFAEITAADESPKISFTSDTAGKPIALTVSETTAGDGSMGTVSTRTANDGPNALTANNVINVATGARALPSGGDTLWIADSDVDLLYNLDALSGVTLAELHVDAGYTGAVGLPSQNSDGADSYREYRTRYLTLGATEVFVGRGSGDGSGRIMIDLQAVQSTVKVFATGSAAEDDFHSLILKGSHASNVLLAFGGQTDVAPLPGETATFATLTATGDAEVRTHEGVALTEVSADGQAVIDVNQDAALAALTTLNVRGEGTATVRGSNAVGTLKALGGRCDYRSSGTITAVEIGSTGEVTAENNANGCTWTDTAIEAGAILRDPHNKVTFTNPIDTGNVGLDEWTLELGKGRNLLPSAP